MKRKNTIHVPHEITRKDSCIKCTEEKRAFMPYKRGTRKRHRQQIIFVHFKERHPLAFAADGSSPKIWQRYPQSLLSKKQACVLPVRLFIMLSFWNNLAPAKWGFAPCKLLCCPQNSAHFRPEAGNHALPPYTYADCHRKPGFDPAMEEMNRKGQGVCCLSCRREGRRGAFIVQKRKYLNGKHDAFRSADI